MFTSDQILFAAIALVIFTIAMIFLYRKDLALHKKHYKGTIWVLVGFIAFFALLFFIKHSLN